LNCSLKSPGVECQLCVFASVNFFVSGDAHLMPARGVDDRGAVDARIARRIEIELRKCRVEEADRAAIGAALDVVIRGRKLNQSLEKRLLVAGRREPDFFPRLVRVPEVMSVEELDAAR
jgi:hypothetical protein